MREILERFEALAQRLEHGDTEGVEAALAEHDRAVRAAFASPEPIDETAARRLLARQHQVHSLLLSVRDRLGEQLGEQRRQHSAVHQYLQDQGE